LKCCGVLCGAVLCSAVQCSAVQCSAVQCSAVQCISLNTSPKVARKAHSTELACIWQHGIFMHCGSVDVLHWSALCNTPQCSQCGQKSSLSNRDQTFWCGLTFLLTSFHIGVYIVDWERFSCMEYIQFYFSFSFPHWKFKKIKFNLVKYNYTFNFKFDSWREAHCTALQLTALLFTALMQRTLD
jgi:hypothetical protein